MAHKIPLFTSQAGAIVIGNAGLAVRCLPSGSGFAIPWYTSTFRDLVLLVDAQGALRPVSGIAGSAVALEVARQQFAGDHDTIVEELIPRRTSPALGGSLTVTPRAVSHRVGAIDAVVFEDAVPAAVCEIGFFTDLAVEHVVVLALQAMLSALRHGLAGVFRHAVETRVVVALQAAVTPCRVVGIASRATLNIVWAREGAGVRPAAPPTAAERDCIAWLTG